MSRFKPRRQYKYQWYNKYDMPLETWERLVAKSVTAWGSKSTFRTIARRRNLSIEAIELLADETIRFKETLRERLRETNRQEQDDVQGTIGEQEISTTQAAGEYTGNETRSAEAGSESITTRGDT